MGTPYIYYYRHTAQTSTLLRPPPTPLPFVLCIPHTILTSLTHSRVRAHTRTQRERGGESERNQRRPHTRTRTSKIAKVANFTATRKRGEGRGRLLPHQHVMSTAECDHSQERRLGAILCVLCGCWVCAG